MTNYELLKLLNENKDEEYKKFNDKIINTNQKTIGVRVPILKNIAKRFSIKDLKEIKDDYYEQTLIKGFVISSVKDIDQMLDELNIFLKKIDNWAICDMVISNCKLIKKHQDKVFLFIEKNITSTNDWMVRACFVMLLDYFINEDKLKSIFSFIENSSNNFYYVMMAKAWLISKCYALYQNETLNFLKNTKIDNKLYNKAIDKICDSKMTSKQDKTKLKGMKKK